MDMRRVVVAVGWLVVAPALAYAQASITGVVKDASGAVLPGVTVEAASPALIEKVRIGVTDGTGQYRIVDLRSGTYAVTFTLPGFGTVKREGLEVAGTFTATLDVELRVGQLEETLTVTGDAPMVDVQSARREQVVSSDIIAALPTPRAFLGLVALNPTVVLSAQDVGGTSGPASVRYTTRGSMQTDSRMMANGLLVGSVSGGGTAGSYYVPQVTASQEVVVTTSGGLGEAETAGVVANTVSRDGGNTYSGLLFGTGTADWLLGSNFTEDLRRQGLRSPNEITRNFDYTAALGGPIFRDKLWFFTYSRYMVADNSVAGMFHNKNAGDASKWTYEPDLDRPGIQNGTWRGDPGALRLTWQGTPRNKFAVMWDEQKRCFGCPQVLATASPEAGNLGETYTLRVAQATWTSPVSNRLLLEAGFGDHILGWGGGLSDPVTQRMTNVVEQAGLIPGLSYRGIASNFHSDSATYHGRTAASYITGAHSAKVGASIAHFRYTDFAFSLSEGLRYRFNNGVPNQLTQTVESVRWRTYMTSLGVYAQDQWTIDRLTLQAGVRYDHWASSFPAEVFGKDSRYIRAPIDVPAADGASFHDISPRVSATYDLFGDAKTAVRVTVGKFMIGQESNGAGTFGQHMTPVFRMATNTSRAWTDANRDFVANCNLVDIRANGECGPAANSNFGTSAFSQTFDPRATSGWGVRPYTWDFGASVQREIITGLSATLGYNRLSFGNLSVRDNLLTTPADYTMVKLPVPVDDRLPNSGEVVTVAVIKPEKFGQVQTQIGRASDLGGIVQRWSGFEASANARMANGLVAQGGMTSGRYLIDKCAVVARAPEILWEENLPLEYCRGVQPFQTQVKGFAAYTVPRLDVQVSATLQNIPGIPVQAAWNVPNAVFAPLLGGNLPGGAANQTINLLNIQSGVGIAPQPISVQAERLTQVDFRVAKLLRFGRTRTLVGVDIFNALNSDTVQSINTTYGTTWLQPRGIIPARFAKLSVQLDF